MFKKRAKVLSINVIIIAVIGLIILVVVIAMFTGRLGQFSEGLDSAITCESTCNAIGMEDSFPTIYSSRSECENRPPDSLARWRYKYLSGKFGDVPEGKVCCCRDDR